MAPVSSPTARVKPNDCGNKYCPKHGNSANPQNQNHGKNGLDYTTSTSSSSSGDGCSSTSSSTFQYAHGNVGDQGNRACGDPNCQKHALKGNIPIGATFNRCKENLEEIAATMMATGKGQKTTKTAATMQTLRVKAPFPSKSGEGFGSLNNNFTTNITNHHHFADPPPSSPTKRRISSPPKMLEEMRREHSAKENAMLQAIVIKQKEEIEALKKVNEELEAAISTEKQTRRMAVHTLKTERITLEDYKKKVESLTEANKNLTQKLNYFDLKARRLKRQASSNAATASKWKTKMMEAKHVQKDLEDRQAAAEKLARFLSSQLRDGRIKMKELKRAFGTSFSDGESNESSASCNSFETSMLEMIERNVNSSGISIGEGNLADNSNS